MPSLTEFITGPLVVIGYVVVGFLLLNVVFNALLPPTHLSVSLGYSMCGERVTYLDFTSLHETSCSILPGDAVLMVYDWPPDVGEVVCAYYPPTDSVVCHRVVSVEDNRVCMEGDAAKWRYCFDEKYYRGTVYLKIPRFATVPTLYLYSALVGNPELVAYIDRGYYLR